MLVLTWCKSFLFESFYGWFVREWIFKFLKNQSLLPSPQYLLFFLSLPLLSLFACWLDCGDCMTWRCNQCSFQRLWLLLSPHGCSSKCYQSSLGWRAQTVWSSEISKHQSLFVIGVPLSEVFSVRLGLHTKNSLTFFQSPCYLISVFLYFVFPKFCQFNFGPLKVRSVFTPS